MCVRKCVAGDSNTVLSRLLYGAKNLFSSPKSPPEAITRHCTLLESYVHTTTPRVGKTADISASARKIPPCVFTPLLIQYIPTMLRIFLLKQWVPQVCRLYAH